MPYNTTIPRLNGTGVDVVGVVPLVVRRRQVVILRVVNVLVVDGAGRGPAGLLRHELLVGLFVSVRVPKIGKTEARVANVDHPGQVVILDHGVVAALVHR